MATLVETMANSYQRSYEYAVPPDIPRARRTAQYKDTAFSNNSVTTLSDLSAPPQHPARKVPQRHHRSESQMLRIGLKTPTYTILGDPPPWAMDDPASSHGGHFPASKTTAPRNIPSSIYSSDTHSFGPLLHDDARVQPLKLRIPANASHAPLNQDGLGSQALRSKSSRLPIFQHVRSMLQRPSPTSPDALGESLGQSPTQSNIHPVHYAASSASNSSAYRSPLLEPSFALHSDFESTRSSSPVSTLRDEELDRGLRAIDDDDVSGPVSPVSVAISRSSAASSRQGRLRNSVSLTDLTRHAAPLPSGLNQGWGQFRRKPMPDAFASDQIYVQTAKQDLDHLSPNHIMDASNSHGAAMVSRMSWSSYAQSMISYETSLSSSSSASSPQVYQRDFEGNEPVSRFSWTTVATGTTWQTRPGTMASSIIAPAIPRVPLPDARDSSGHQIVNANTARGSSVLERGRPVNMHDDTRRFDRPNGSIVSSQINPSPVDLTSDQPKSPTSTDAHKALPLPPQLHPSALALSHLDALLVQERDLAIQRGNVSRGIRDLERIEKSSPIDVPFTAIRDAKKRMVQYKARLEEIGYEQREIGILITRARRKEGVEEGLWVRRVTS